MLTREQYKRISKTMPIFYQADDQLIREFQNNATLSKIPAGRDVFVEGDFPDSIALILSGVVRVYKIGQTGREITLYRFGLGESCILTANAILSNKSFPAIATVEEEIEAVIIPGDIFRKWVNQFDLWRDFVFNLLSDRLSLVLSIVDEILFQRLDERVANWLIKQKAEKNILETTHQEIAAELGSSREVISRILEDFKQDGLIESGRGMIKLVNITGLKSRAGM